MSAVAVGHIEVDAKGVARIAGSRLQVKHIAVYAQEGQTPEQIREAYPFLTLGEIYAALSFYYDHKAEIDAEIRRDEEEIERLRREAPESPFVKRMKAEGRL